MVDTGGIVEGLGAGSGAEPVLEIGDSVIQANSTGGIVSVRSTPDIFRNHLIGNTGAQIHVVTNADDRQSLPFIVRNELDGFGRSAYGIRVVGPPNVPLGPVKRRWLRNNLVDHKQYAAFSQRFRINMAANWWGAKGPVLSPPGAKPPIPNSVNANILTDPPLDSPAAVPARALAQLKVSVVHPSPPAEPECAAPTSPPPTTTTPPTTAPPPPPPTTTPPTTAPSPPPPAPPTTTEAPPTTEPPPTTT